MRGLQLLVGTAALVAFDAALIWGVRHWQARSMPSAGVVAVKPRPLPVLSPMPKPMQTMCADGATWGYDDMRQRWFKLEPVQRCELGSVRGNDIRAGRLVVHPPRKHG